MFKVTSENRLAARKLLNTFKDSRIVRGLTLSQLQSELQTAITCGILTDAGVQRVLSTSDAKPQASEPMTLDELARRGQVQRDAMQAHKTVPAPRDADLQAMIDQLKAYADSMPVPQPAPAQSDASDNADYVTRPEWTEGREQDALAVNAKLADVAKTVTSQFATVITRCDANGDAVRAQGERIIALESRADVTRVEIVQRDTVTKTFDCVHAMFPTVLKYIQAGLNVALVGPAGTGKSTIAAQVARALDLGFRSTGAVMSKYDLIGYCDAAGSYHASPLYEAYTSGMLFCFDELDGSAPDAVVTFNGITDNQKQYAFPCGMREKHAKFVAIACMNTWGTGANAEYVGRYRQDAASMDRYVRVFIDYDRGIESKLGSPEVCQRVWKLREAIATLGIRHVVSTRNIVKTMYALSVGVDKATIDRDILFASLTDEQVAQIAPLMQGAK